MKFKNDIELQAGLEDLSGSTGTSGQILSSTATGTAWIDPSTIVAEAATLVVIACKNTSGAAIAQGTPVYQTGTVGATATIEIAPADALISENKLPAIGLLQTDLNNNGFGNVVITGELTSFTTSPIDGVVPTTGDKVFVKSGGGLTLTKPTGEGNGIQNMGLVGKVSGGNSGSITVSSIMRTNDVPNLPEGRIWVGDGNTIVSDTVYIDEPNNRVGIGTSSPNEKLSIDAGAQQDALSINSSDGDGPYAVWRRQGVSMGFVGNSNALSLSGNTNFGVRATNDLVFAAGGASERMRIDSDGNVGIGTDSPAYKLHVNGGDAQIANGSTATLYMNNSANYLYGDVNGVGIVAASNNFRVKTNNSERLRIIQNGNVGIGTTSPSARLEVSDSNTIKTAIHIDNTSTGGNRWDIASIGSGVSGRVGNLQIRNDSDTLNIVEITASGNVGIGTTSPTDYGTTANTLEVRGASGTGTGLIRVSNADNTVGTSLYSSNGAGTLNVQTNNSLTFATNNNEKMRITADGKLLIGYTSEVNNAGSVQVDGYIDIDHDRAFRLYDSTFIGGFGNGIWATGNETYRDDAAVYAVNDLLLMAGGNSTPDLIVAANGNVGIGTTSPSEKLDVVGNIELNGALYISNSGIYQQSNSDVSGLELVANVSLSFYRAAFFDYVIQKEGNVRAGTVFACNDGGSVEYTETSTNDIGDTSDVVLSVDILAGNMRLLADAATSGWSVKSLIRAI